MPASISPPFANEEEIVTRHFGESLFAAHHLFPTENSSQEFVREGRDFSRANTDSRVGGALSPEDRDAATNRARLADLGSGAGFPGIPIKLWAPEISVTLIESNHKKATFLREVIRSLTLTDVDIQNVRAEDLTQTFDIVTFRAVERFAEILPVAARLLAPRGRLALLIASSQYRRRPIRPSPTSLGRAPIPIPESDLPTASRGQRHQQQ